MKNLVSSQTWSNALYCHLVVDVVSARGGSGDLTARPFDQTCKPGLMTLQDKRVSNRGSVIFDDLSPTHGALPITPLIDIPKGISSKMGLEVA